MAARIREALPGRDVQIAGPLTLGITGPDGDGPRTVNLDRVWNVCQSSDAVSCEASISNFVAASGELVTERPQFTRGQLRVMVRSEEYCVEVRRLYAERSQTAQTRSLPGELCAVLVADAPNTMRLLGADDLNELGLIAAEAWPIAERQTLANLPDPASLTFENGLAVVGGREYVPSLILAADGWRSLAAAQGEILMAVPSDGGLVAFRASDVPDLSRLGAVVEQEFANGERGISRHIYRWTAQGWAIAR
ncbi:MAG TPA: hypothetical protein VEW04_11850 [Allosphingosinicella sp.]|nr:hypothetical protein [Allosphingosinicella sp.]